MVTEKPYVILGRLILAVIKPDPKCNNEKATQGYAEMLVKNVLFYNKKSNQYYTKKGDSFIMIGAKATLSGKDEYIDLAKLTEK